MLSITFLVMGVTVASYATYKVHILVAPVDLTYAVASNAILIQKNISNIEII